MVFIFPVRACWALWDLTCSLKKASRTKNWRDFRSWKSIHKRSSSLSSSETLTPGTQASASSSDSGEADGDYFADAETERYQDIYAILIPNYKEDMEVLRETLEVLASHRNARSQYDVSIIDFARF
jgi:hypothetical protein